MGCCGKGSDDGRNDNMDMGDAKDGKNRGGKWGTKFVFLKPLTQCVLRLPHLNKIFTRFSKKMWKNCESGQYSFYVTNLFCIHLL